MKKLCPKCRKIFKFKGDLCPKHGVPLINDYSGCIVDDRYIVGSIIGLGGTGAVFQAEHVRMKRQVAIKFLPKTNAEEAARFQREAQATSLLTNPNIVSVFDFGETPEGELFLVMELLKGESVGRLRGTVVEPRRVFEIARQVCQALEIAHSAGIVHRDLKPDNIFLVAREDESLFVKVLDFGIAKVLTGQTSIGEDTITTGGVVCGTPYYMAPEQVTGQEIDQRTDIYALAVIIFQMLTGKRLFEGESVNHLLSKHVYEAAPALRTVVPELNYSEQLELFLSRCLEKEPSKRFTGIDEVRERLEDFLNGDLPINMVPAGMKDETTVADNPPQSSGMRVFASTGKKLGPKGKILFVDDSLYLAAEMAKLLAVQGFEVLLARDGNEGIEQLTIHPDVKVCITDINMPGMNGLEFLSHVRKVMGMKTLRVMVMSTEDSRQMFEKGEDLDVLAWIVKPARPDILLGAIEEACE